MCVGLSFFVYTLLTMFDLGTYPCPYAWETEFSNGFEASCPIHILSAHVINMFHRDT